MLYGDIFDTFLIEKNTLSVLIDGAQRRLDSEIYTLKL